MVIVGGKGALHFREMQDLATFRRCQSMDFFMFLPERKKGVIGMLGYPGMVKPVNLRFFSDSELAQFWTRPEDVEIESMSDLQCQHRSVTLG